MPFEEILKNIIEVRFKRPAQRPYQTNNFYTVLHKQAALDKEVLHIVQKNSVKQAHKSRPKGNRRSGRKSARR